MKKFLIFLFLAGSIFSVLFAAEPKLKFAVVSDIHEKWNELDKVFSFLARKDLDAVLFGGDLANGNPASYKKYAQLYDKHFSGKKKVPVHIAILGNHDYLGYPRGSKRPTAQESLKRFFTPLGQKASWLVSRKINGYTFIGVSATDDKGENLHTPVEIKQVSDLIGKAEKEFPGRPVFVMTHCPPAFTLLRSPFSAQKAPKARYHWRTDHIRKMLEGHTAAVSISGHTHLALQDERCIWQGDFTAIHGGVLRWVTPQKPAPEEGLVENVDRFKGRNFIYVEVFENKIVIYRFDANTLEEIKPQQRWQVVLPYSPAAAVYTAERAQKTVAPEFPAGAKFKIIRIKKHHYLQFDRAEHPEMVLAYKIKLIYDNKKYPVQEFFVSSDYFLPGNDQKRLLNMNERVKLVSGASGTMQITPFETFGKAGKMVVSRFEIPTAPKK